jgi:hypothetical protein
MTNPYRRVAEWADDVQFRKNLNKKELEITLPYYRDIFIEKTPVELADLDKIRESLRPTLTSIFKSTQIANNFLDYLTRTDDLVNFYQLEKPFLRQIEGTRNIDLNYMTDLWKRYRTKMLKNIEKSVIENLNEELLKLSKLAPTKPKDDEDDEEKIKRLIDDLSDGILPINKDTKKLYASFTSANGAIQTLIKNNPDFMKYYDEQAVEKKYKQQRIPQYMKATKKSTISDKM